MRIKLVHVYQINERNLIIFIHEGDSLLLPPLPDEFTLIQTRGAGAFVKKGGAGLCVFIYEDFTGFTLYPLEGTMKSYWERNIKLMELEEAKDELWIFISSYYTEKKRKEITGLVAIIPSKDLNDRQRLYIQACTLGEFFIKTRKKEKSDIFIDQIFMDVFQLHVTVSHDKNFDLEF